MTLALFFRILGLAGLLFLSACGDRIAHHALPEALASAGEIAGYGQIRFYGDEAPPNIEARLAGRIKALKERFASDRQDGNPSQINLLALSGGSEDGAFGAGFLVGWSEDGRRPAFDMVTGISTGGLAAPFVFLGPDYDHVLEELYTTTTKKQIFKACVVCGLFGGPAFANTKPLRRMIEANFTAEMFEKIAAEHRKGRRLWIGTTNLDSGRPVIWDIGALAASGQPGALELFHKILLATSAIPGFFPPVAFVVETDGQPYTELHSDGGATFITFLYPPEIIGRTALEQLGDDIEVNLYVILNAKNPPYYKETKPATYDILKRALYVTVQNKAVGDALRVYEIARRDGLDYHMIMIPAEFGVTPVKDFDIDYMNALFEEGARLGRMVHPWLPAPPGADSFDNQK